jgi:hypothetical protein
VAFQFDPPVKSTYRNWLSILALCRHIRGVKERFLSEFLQEHEEQSAGGVQRIYVNRIHFPIALLQNRTTYGLSRFNTLMKPAIALRISRHDDNNLRILEACNTVASLENFAERILPKRFFEIFKATMSVADKSATTKSLKRKSASFT